MYEIYKTKAVVIKKRDKGDNDRSFFLFTQDFGLIWISGIGIKKEKSKLRSFFQEFSFLEVFLVKGKTGYRIVGGKEIENIFFIDMKFRRKKIQIIKKNFLLLENLLIRDYKDKVIFNLFLNFIFDLVKVNEFEKIKIKEVLFLVDFLNHFGYFDKKNIKKEIEINNQYLKKLILEINQKIKKIPF